MKVSDAAAVFAFKNQAWRRIFWVSLPPGVLFVLGGLFVAESPRWLFLRGKKELAYASLLRSRSPEQADTELREMEQTASSAKIREAAGNGAKGTLFRRKYVIPFILTCVILFCNTATGVNSIIGYNTSILLQSGLSDLYAHWGYVIFTVVNFLFTIVGLTLVDKKGRKFLLIVGTTGAIISMSTIATLFLRTEAHKCGRSRYSAGDGETGAGRWHCNSMGLRRSSYCWLAGILGAISGAIALR